MTERTYKLEIILILSLVVYMIISIVSFVHQEVPFLFVKSSNFLQCPGLVILIEQPRLKSVRLKDIQLGFQVDKYLQL